ncbi:MAG TPA: glycosyltransferase family 2 protein [Bryobacteraceae bacterium]|nr:glycosyltransferase family 2 protein [Bryobacteraceae bacterium]
MDFPIAVFILSAVSLLYVLFGYPLLLAVWPCRRPTKAANTPERWQSVTVVLPVRNGERWMRAKLETLRALDYPRELVDILVIADNCTDRTEEIVREFGDGVRLLRSPGSGKASAINHALAHSESEILFFTDVRQPLEPSALSILVACFDDPKVGVATGELIIRTGESREEENVGLYWQYEKWIRQRHSAIDSVLGATGAIYAIRRSLACPLPNHTLLDDVHIPMCAFFSGYRIQWAGDARANYSPTALDAEFRRKVRTLAGVYQLIGKFPALLGPGNRMWFHFISHKFGRLMLPFALLALFASSFFLPSPWSGLLIAAQLGFYALAWLDGLIPERTLPKRITSIVRTFVVLMTAALCAASILFRSSESFWRSPTKT